MARFCTHCGNTLPDDVAFCDTCGQAVGAKQTPALTADSRTKRTPSRAMLLGGAGALLLLSAGAAFLFLPGSEPPTDSSLARLLNADKPFMQDRTCLDNFDYTASPTHVSPYDQRTRQWLQVLVEAGLYTEPERIVSNRGLFSQERLQYEQTPAGKAAVHDGKLCFAAGIAVTSVQYTPPRQHNDLRLARGEVRYQYEKPAPWISTPDAISMLPDRFGKDSHEAVIYLGKRGSEDWALLSHDAARRLERQMTANTTTQAESGSMWELTDFFSGLFQGNPAASVMGKWTMQQGSQVVHFEFMPDTMIAEGEKTSVSYVVNGNNVRVNIGSEADESLALVIVSDAEIRVDTGFGRLPLYRVH